MTPKPDPKRRAPASRPGKAGDTVRRRRSAKPSAKPSSKPSQTAGHTSRNGGRSLQEHVVEPIKRQAAESVEQRSDQRLGFTARRAAVLAALVCVLTLTITGPVRTYFAQRTEMEQLSASEAALRRQISDLEQKKSKLDDPAYIAAQARERLGFVMPGSTPFQVQLPPTAAVPAQPGSPSAKPASSDPWYTALWHTIADNPHLPPNAPETPGPATPPSPPGG
ncbi:FtsB family cell division protein [Mycobacterium parmense]|uniref:Septation inhibitor protein n=1 Tax=Mycobacterium parmense TaxID=185642 RepID=A0A7I7Z216_9MYCO|nr:septum formation initiator family protein [Mycobacterium parmense]MCV7352050.1 septum formation initiator family protein [Mycobacterium parmense]ORW56062.1 septation inhibitor protein [Mycobacterium parmense]BBZ48235.1 septation inhibitor protein [Mycobacterium parmense]